MPQLSSGLTLQQLRYFIEVAAEGSISAAADLLYVAQPTMSAAMKDLEARVGRALLVRSARGVTLTADGAEFPAMRGRSSSSSLSSSSATLVGHRRDVCSGCQRSTTR